MKANEGCVLLSLCIPTNGMYEWVLPILDSIYEENVDENAYEIVISDNGDRPDFKEHIKIYCNNHNNIRYQHVITEGFLNQVHAFKAAKGEFIKFLNHRDRLEKGALKYLIDIIRDNIEEKPVIYFMNAVISSYPEISKYNSFDSFIAALKRYASWSAGIGCWREDISNITLESDYNYYFPHLNFLFNVKDRDNYIINNKKLTTEIEPGLTKKGKYDFFYAFGVEFPAVVLELYRNNYICRDTFLKIKDDIKEFLAYSYLSFIIRKVPISYDLSKYKDGFGIFYSEHEIKRKAISMIPILLAKKILGKIKSKKK